MKPLRAALALVLGFCAVLTACSLADDRTGAREGQAEEDAPLAYRDDGSRWCMPAPRYPEVALGKGLDFESGGPLTIENVEAVGAQGLELIETYVVRVPDNEARAGAGPFPPTGTRTEKVAWRSAKPAIGASIPPNERWDLIAHLSYTGPGRAGLDTLALTYRQGDDEYTVKTYESLRLAAKRC